MVCDAEKAPSNRKRKEKSTKQQIKSRNEENVQKDNIENNLLDKKSSKCGLCFKTCHTTDSKTENDQNKPQNNLTETFLWSFMAVLDHLKASFLPCTGF